MRSLATNYISTMPYTNRTSPDFMDRRYSLKRNFTLVFTKDILFGRTILSTPFYHYTCHAKILAQALPLRRFSLVEKRFSCHRDVFIWQDVSKRQ